MPLFQYKAIRGANGDLVSGTHEGANIRSVEEWLSGRNEHPVEITPLEGGMEGSGGSRPGILLRLRGISLEDKILFCRQMSTMLEAGVAILQALRIMQSQAVNPILANLYADVGDRIEQGANLSDSFAKYPKFSSPLFYNILRVGEETGTLDRSFGYLAELYENEKEVAERIKAATRYPKIVVAAIVAAVLFLMSFVVPKFVSMFENARVELPLPTRILIAVSDFTTSYLPFILLGMVVTFIGYRFAMKSTGIRTGRDHLWLRVPIFGPLSLKVFMSRFCRVFGILLKSGVDMIRTLELSATAMDNLVLLEMVDRATDEVRDGVELNRAMQKNELFPDMVVQMVAIGEQSGKVDEMMEKVAQYYEREADYTIRNLSTLIEPMLLLVMGVLVGFLALAIYMPMWDMMRVMRG